ncbi:hypothetical protein J5O04_00185 [Corynebacterium hindlerae]|uniref:3-hydroxyacyl-CoA dehydrogenase family protein n=1 Tax=Corynebacterium hindlerae TaxID=699041 RepID=UPI001AD711AA|nr:3-hydroxyacyl-CoA dehydrogenase family protein [Corynebacterium hindlerae]QTH59609.1 hypothetical protein J5O04_00185 [Corynebacterium hindlerae]
MPISTAAVIGAGSMGAGIAALMASSGIKVYLFDLERDGAQRGIDLQLQRGGFPSPELAENVTPASTATDLDLVKECDWVVEAIFENLQAKHDLYRQLELKDGAYLSSNTSTLPLSELVRGVKDPDRFAITHFFNPPHIMQLVELVAPHSETHAALEQAITDQLGKTALTCRDTPGFIANRVGCFWLAAGVHLARKHGLSYELADATFGRPFGIPRTGIFGLLDYIGLQLVDPIWGSLEDSLPADDGYSQYPLRGDAFIAGLVERGLTGRTGPGGFYRGREETIDTDFTYRPRQTPTLPADEPRELMASDTPSGNFARELFHTMLEYCHTHCSEIANSPADIDTGLKLGFGWKKGIFELAEDLGEL